MKKILTKLMIFVITIFLVLVIGFNYKVRVHTSHVELESLSADYFWQIEQLSIQSQRNIKEVKEDFSKTVSFMPDQPPTSFRTRKKSAMT